VQPHADPVMAIDLSPSGDQIISAGGDSSISRSRFEILSTPRAADVVPNYPPRSTLSSSMKTPQASSSWARPTMAEETASSIDRDRTAPNLLSLDLCSKDAVHLPVKGKFKQLLTSSLLRSTFTLLIPCHSFSFFCRPSHSYSRQRYLIIIVFVNVSTKERRV
jgi:hypothetical protein